MSLVTEFGLLCCCISFMSFSLEKLGHFAIFAFMCYSMNARDLTILSAYMDVHTKKDFNSWSVNGYKKRQEHKA